MPSFTKHNCIYEINAISELYAPRRIGRAGLAIPFLFPFGIPLKEERRSWQQQLLTGPTVPWLKSSLAKVSSAPLLKNTRLPLDAITGNYDAFRDEGLSPDEAIAETLDCYPEAGLDAIKAILSYRDARRGPVRLRR